MLFLNDRVVWLLVHFKAKKLKPKVVFYLWINSGDDFKISNLDIFYATKRNSPQLFR